MDRKVAGRSGEFVDENGRTDFWWDGHNYGCILPEELIDEKLIALRRLEEEK